MCHLEQAGGLYGQVCRQNLAAILTFEVSTGFKPSKRFHIEQAARSKAILSRAKTCAGKALGHSTLDATLPLGCRFFH
jgi:hypothetical protein